MSGAAGWPRLEFDDDDTDISLVPAMDASNDNLGSSWEGVYNWISMPPMVQESEPEWAKAGSPQEK
jgi:hypothetical protein